MSAETVATGPAQQTHRGWIPRGDFPARLKLVRKEVGLSARAASAQCGIHYATWSTWERGVRPANIGEAVEKIADAFGVDKVWLMWGGPLGEGMQTREEETRKAPTAEAVGAAACTVRDSNPEPAD